MPYTADTYSLPFSGRGPRQRHNSLHAALAQRPVRGRKKTAMLAYIQQHGMVTDQGLAEGLGLPIQSVCSLRCSLRDAGVIEWAGDARGVYGKTVSLWRAVGQEVSPCGTSS
jgi:hypothetical protein